MVDTRFHHFAGPMKLAELFVAAGHADMVAESPGESVVAGASDLLAARPGDIGFIADKRYLPALTETRASFIVTSPEFGSQVPKEAIVLKSADPYADFVDLLEVLYPDNTARAARRGAKGPAAIDATAELEEGVVVAPGAVIGANAEIGTGTVIGPNAIIGPGVAIGRHCVIGAGASLECTLAGNRIVVQPGARIGTEGFGFLPRPGGARKIPQLGRAILQDGVEIGANTTIDRGTLIDTVVGEGTKIDNLVQIAHNCRIGRHCQIAANSGLAGSTVVGDHVLMGGNCKSAGFLTIGDHSILYAGTAVSKDFPAQSRLAGVPARDVKQWRREVAALTRLGRRSHQQ